MKKKLLFMVFSAFISACVLSAVSISFSEKAEAVALRPHCYKSNPQFHCGARGAYIFCSYHDMGQ
jgi:hypothetical protein